ncbi:hypothetical protein M8C21_010040 [Ambrosia artemisiifolia]|uniref:Uncharacterized protein n=1 Tax=Ambrosia artemisiifolia TaxID=4212 RepID=A0AAD5GHV8_AMBAR|nr:hypothetical protein M8C21_010040 [Ambrosia artemisiifolia]
MQAIREVTIKILFNIFDSVPSPPPLVFRVVFKLGTVKHVGQLKFLNHVKSSDDPTTLSIYIHISPTSSGSLSLEKTGYTETDGMFAKKTGAGAGHSERTKREKYARRSASDTHIIRKYQAFAQTLMQQSRRFGSEFRLSETFGGAAAGFQNLDVIDS